MSALGSQFRRLAAKADARSIPLSVQLELTGRCPLRCQHCYLAATPPEELPTAVWLDLLDQLADAGTMFLTLTGGELFLRRDLFDVAARARELGMAVTLLTSGTGVRDEDLDRIAALHPLVVGISLYSADAEAHDEVTRTPGSHARALTLVTALRERQVRVRLKAPLMQPTVSEVRGVAAIGEAVGAEVSFDPLTIVCRDGRCDPAELRPTPEVLAEALALPQVQPTGLPLLAPPRDAAEPPCSAGRRVATILPNGDVTACSLHPTPLGNIGSTTFAEIWRGGPVLDELRGMAIADLDASCAPCNKSGYCGRCSALAMLEEGGLRGPSRASCDLAEARERAHELVQLRMPRAG